VSERHRVILIRPWDMSDGVGAGCCSGGSTKGLCTTPEHHQTHAGFGERDDWGPFALVYRALRDALPEGVDLEVVDPRNHLFLIPTLVSDSRRRGEGWLGALGSAIHGPSYAAIIVDGATVSSGDVLAPDEAVRIVRAALGLTPTE
jgi:hypothetical protein